MIHARSDYARIQDPALHDPTLCPGSPIAEDEPVFLVRAKDMAFVATLSAWQADHFARGGDISMIRMLNAHILLAEEWQARNFAKVADLPK